MWHLIMVNEMWYNMKSTIILIWESFGISFFFPPSWLGDFSKDYSVDLGQAHEAECVVGRGWDFWIRASGCKCVPLAFSPLVKSFSFSEFSFLICKILILIWE